MVSVSDVKAAWTNEGGRAGWKTSSLPSLAARHCQCPLSRTPPARVALSSTRMSRRLALRSGKMQQPGRAARKAGQTSRKKTYVRFVGVLLFMVALWNRADHYIFMLWFVLSSSFFFLFFIPRLISAAADWMSVILPHMVWP